jgi:hypothetical protein
MIICLFIVMGAFPPLVGLSVGALSSYNPTLCLAFKVATGSALLHTSLLRNLSHFPKFIFLNVHIFPIPIFCLN